MVFFNRIWFFFHGVVDLLFVTDHHLKRTVDLAQKSDMLKIQRCKCPNACTMSIRMGKKCNFKYVFGDTARNFRNKKNLDFPIWGKWGIISSNCTFLVGIIFWKLMSGIFCNIFSEFYSTLLWWYMQEMKPSNWART